jgi:hypothetical protein
VVGLAIFFTAVVVGLNEYAEGSFPAWGKVLEGLGVVLLVLGLIVGFVRLPKERGGAR